MPASESSRPTAKAVLGTIPLIWRIMRNEIQSGPRSGLTLPQFRTLGAVRHEPGASLTEIAANLGLRPPAASKLVDGLVGRGLLARSPAAADRRRIELALTPKGHSALRQVRRAAEAKLGERLAVLSPRERALVRRAMKVLQGAFAAPDAGRDGNRTKGARP